jgi:hypothetical protein
MRARGDPLIVGFERHAKLRPPRTGVEGADAIADVADGIKIGFADLISSKFRTFSVDQ